MKPSIYETATTKGKLQNFMEKEFDKMIKFSDWKKGEVLKELIKKELGHKPR